MGQHQSLAGVDGSVGVIPTPPNNSIPQQCKDLVTPEQNSDNATDKGSTLSFRTAIDNFIESCLSNPTGNNENSQDGVDTPKELPKDEAKVDRQTSAVPGEHKANDTSSEKDVEISDKNPEESLDRAKTFSSFLQMRIRDMIVNCENDEELCSNVSTMSSNTASSSSSSSIASIPSPVSSVTHQSVVTSPNVPKTTVSSQLTSTQCSSSVTTSRQNSYTGKLDIDRSMTSVPLQTLIDKVLDNSLGGDILSPENRRTDNSVSQVESSDHKPKSSASYEIAAEPAKFVSEKVARCVERNTNNSENSLSSKTERPGILLMDHIEKVLEENFAQMTKIEEEEALRNEPPPLKAMSAVHVSYKPDTSNRSLTPVKADKPHEASYNASSTNAVKQAHNPNLSKIVTNPDGTISVQDIVDRVISQTEVISNLLAPGYAPASAKPVQKQETPSRSSSHRSYERNVQTNSASKSDAYTELIRQQEFLRAAAAAAESHKTAKAFHPYHSREDYNNHNMTVSRANSEYTEKHSRYNQILANEKNIYHKSNLYPSSEIQEMHHIDHMLINESQRQKLIQENMLLLSSRYPYPLHMASSVEPRMVPPLMRYCPPATIHPQRMPPPLLRVEGPMDPGVSAIPHPHAYNKNCSCVTCCSHRNQFEEMKRPPKQMNPALLVPPNAVNSPRTSPHYNPRLSPASKDIMHATSHSPLRYHPSAFTRTKDTHLPERNLPQKIHHTCAEVVQHKKSRIENGIDMFYNDKRRHPDSDGPHIQEAPYSKNKHQPHQYSTKLPEAHRAHEVRAAHMLDLTIDTMEPNVAADQPLDLTKKKPKTAEVPTENYYKWPVSREEYEERNNTRCHISSNPYEQRFMNQERVNYTTAPEHFRVSAEKDNKDYNKYVERSPGAPYATKPELSRLKETPATMTPGMMPDHLGSPGGRRPQLHPLPSPNLSTCYTQPNVSPQFAHSISPTSASPDGERGPNNESINISRPSSQCSSSPIDHDKERRSSISRHEPIQNIIGSHPPNDILYLICRLCRQTYGSPYGFRKHFRNQHGFEPRAEHTIVQTISATKSAMLHTPGMADSPNTLSQNHNLLHGTHQPFPDGHVMDIVDMPKVRERAASDSRLLKSAMYAETKSSRPNGSRSVENRRPSVKEESDDTKFLQCEQCKQTFQLNDFGSYKRHCRQHNQARHQGAFQCQVCPSAFQEPQHLQEHMLKHDVETAVCKYCKIPYATKEYLEDHLRKVHGDEIHHTTNSCTHCHLQFTDYSEYLIHLQKVHGGLLDTEKAGDSRKYTGDCGSNGAQLPVKPSVRVEIHPADQMTTVTCPDSSSDNSNLDKNRSQVSDSTTGVLPKNCPDFGIPKSSPASNERCSSAETRSHSNENSQDTVSSYGNSDIGEENFYKHKKFFGHRKRKESSDVSTISPKCAKTDADNVGSPKCEEVTSNVNSTVTCTSSCQISEGEKACDSSSFPNNSVYESETCSVDSEKLQNKQEARHQMPFVWDRVTRSQAGKNIKPPDYMA
ncbi:uncharacterized protein LOC126820415 isoform X2 [Patella vulgata]|nr:uncharacterized protein LOC126820415 isoform X2 [Patella vulgata]